MRKKQRIKLIIEKNVSLFLKMQEYIHKITKEKYREHKMHSPSHCGDSLLMCITLLNAMYGIKYFGQGNTYRYKHCDTICFDRV